MIPVELSDIAADMMTLHDDLETERTALHVERTTLHVAIDSARRQRKALMLSIGFHFGGFAAWAIAAVVVFQAGVK